MLDIRAKHLKQLEFLVINQEVSVGQHHNNDTTV